MKMKRMTFQRYNRFNPIPASSIPSAISINSAENNQTFESQRVFSTRQFGDRDLYKILGVPRTASQEEIKKAFYTLSKKYHPDVVGSNVASANRFLEVKEAYDILKDEQKRNEYDRQREISQHYTWQSNHQRARTMDREIDPEFYRIWRTMQQDPEFQEATKNFTERQRKMRQEAWERQQERRQEMFTNNGDEPIWDAEKLNRGREFLRKVLIIYALTFIVAVILNSFIERNIGGPRITAKDIRDEDRRIIEEMMKKVP